MSLRSGKPRRDKRWGGATTRRHTPLGGGQGTAAKSLLFEVLKRATSDQQGWPKVQRIPELRQNLSISLVREVEANFQFDAEYKTLFLIDTHETWRLPAPPKSERECEHGGFSATTIMIRPKGLA